MQIYFIVAHSYLQGISNKNKIPWNSKNDLKFIKNITTLSPLKNSLIMGRKTFESIGRVLPKRHNIVITSSPQQNEDNLSYATNIIEGITIAKDNNTDILWVFGGASIYDQFLQSNFLNEMITGFVITQAPEFECDQFIENNIYEFIRSHNMHHKNKSFVLENTNEGEFILNIYSNTHLPNEWIKFFKNEGLELIGGNQLDKDYLSLVERILSTGEPRKTRNGNTISKFSDKISVDLSQGFPLLTTKKVFFNSVIHELLWFIKGDTNSKTLEALKVNIWKGNTTKEFLSNSNLPYQEGIGGPIYGYQWRNFGQKYQYTNQQGEKCTTEGVESGLDQLQYIIDEIRQNPSSRRLFMSGWNPNQLQQMCLPPCHVSYQFYVQNGKLSCQMYQRSADVFLGLPFNIASTALLTHLIANITDLEVGWVHICIGDTHIYEDHLPAIKTQLERMEQDYELPKLVLKKKPENIEDYEFSDIEIMGYKCHPAIRAKMLA